jgi:hypothetical protein
MYGMASVFGRAMGCNGIDETAGIATESFTTPDIAGAGDMAIGAAALGWMIEAGGAADASRAYVVAIAVTIRIIAAHATAYRADEEARRINPSAMARHAALATPCQSEWISIHANRGMIGSSADAK